MVLFGMEQQHREAVKHSGKDVTGKCAGIDEAAKQDPSGSIDFASLFLIGRAQQNADDGEQLFELLAATNRGNENARQFLVDNVGQKDNLCIIVFTIVLLLLLLLLFCFRTCHDN